MTTVTLRRVTEKNFRECIQLSVSGEQRDLVAPNLFSLAQAFVNRDLTPLAIYDGSVFSREPGPDDHMVGFVMYQVRDEVGFIMRLMIEEQHQRRGFGRATIMEVVRRLKLMPEVRTIATSYVHHNRGVERLYHNQGFRLMVPQPPDDPEECYVALDWRP